MAEQITFSIPKPLYQRASELARKRNQRVDDVLEAAITMVEATLTPSAGVETAMDEEITAYQAMHAELMGQYTDEYVAIFQGKLIDHDRDELALLHRVDASYRDEVVLIKQVRPLPESELRFRSPRFARNGS